MTDQELDAEVDRLSDEIIAVIDGENALAADYAMIETMAAGCCSVEDCRRMIDLTVTALTERMLQLATGMEVLH